MPGGVGAGGLKPPATRLSSGLQFGKLRSSIWAVPATTKNKVQEKSQKTQEKQLNHRDQVECLGFGLLI
jgi:DNA-binding transcriptional regulator PaaX